MPKDIEEKIEKENESLKERLWSKDSGKFAQILRKRNNNERNFEQPIQEEEEEEGNDDDDRDANESHLTINSQ